jgi:hypothetical protein
MNPWLSGWLDHCNDPDAVTTTTGGFEALESIRHDVLVEWGPLSYDTDWVLPRYNLDPAPISVRSGEDMTELMTLVDACDKQSGCTPETVVANELFSVVRYVKAEGGLHGQELVLKAEQVEDMVRLLKLSRNDASVVVMLHSAFEADRKSRDVDHSGSGPFVWLFAVTHARAPTVDQLLSSSYPPALD